MFGKLMQETFLGNHVQDYGISLLLFLGYMAVIYLAKVIVVLRLKVWAEKTKTTFDDFVIKHIEKTVLPLLAFGGFMLSIKNLAISPGVNRAISVAGMIFVTIMGLLFILSLIDYILNAYANKGGDTEARKRSLKGVMIVVKVIVFGVAMILLFDNLGIKISALVAGLGIGGVAVALASQAVLADLFSFFVILFDRPFEIGDFIVAGDFMGTVEHVGIKTTRLRSISGEQVVISNTDLTNTRLRNYKRMEQRRVVFSLGITYQTVSQQAGEIPVIIKKIITGIKDTTFDRAHFSSFGDSALIYEVVYNVKSGDYNKYMDIQQEINFKIKDEFEKRKIEFAYPTQTIFINK